MKKLVAIVLTLMVAASSASAWWDTWVRAQKSEPLVKSLDAATIAGSLKTVDDKQANGGAGGKAAVVAPGESLSFDIDLKNSCYSVWMIARADAKDYKDGAPAAEQEYELPGGTATIKSPRPPVYATLQVKLPDGSEKSWYMPIAFRNDYRIVSKLYFPLNVDGKCRITVGLDKRSKLGLLFNRVEVRDVLGNCVRQAIKTQGQAAAAETKVDPNKTYRLGRGGSQVQFQIPAQKLAGEERAKRSDEVWGWVPDINMMDADPRFGQWHSVIGRDGAGLHDQMADLYRSTGNANVGMDAALLLCAIAEKYPVIDYYYLDSGQYSQIASSATLTWGTRLGKTVYSGWAGGDLSRLAASYDKLFGFIKGNQALADQVGRKIPWVKTPKDVIQLLDTNLLQHGIDCVNRDIIRSDQAREACLKVLGVSLGQNMPDAPVFKMARALVEDPSDENLSYNSRGDVHYIGSALYVGWGKPKGYLNVAGFPLILGDGGDMSRKQEAVPEYPSRVYEGFGATILEAGQGQSNPQVKRGIGIFTGIGRGHSHQDTLNFEIFAHGTRLAPDLGGRHEGSYRSSPNMRLNRMHNVVWIDNKEFHNSFPGSTTSGTGWTESFSPQPGSQYTSSFGRATSHKNVSLYQRSTAMIDGQVTDQKADVYFFDVFRVQGGKDHVYCFHGADADEVEANVKLSPAKEDDVTKWVLASRMDKNPQEGPSADPLVMTWPSRSGMTPSGKVGLTMTLFGHGNDRVYMGRAKSEAYPVDMPFLHLYSTGADGRASVYPAILEPYAGERFITEARNLKVEPASDDAKRGVALRVVTKQGRTDTIYSSLQPDKQATVEQDTKVSGEFGFISEDAKGLAAAHLVGGTELIKGQFAIRCDKPLYSATITKVDYDNRDLTLDADLPATILDKAVALIRNDQHQEAWNLESAGGRKAKVQKRIVYYQSVVESVDAKNGLVATEREPDVYGPDTEYTKGTVLANESNGKIWKAVYAPQERWMYLGWPNTDLSYPRVVRMEDLPDADGDGKRTLKLMGNGSEAEPKDKVVLTLEVTRTDPDNFTFYFKMPENPDYQTGGWQFANRELVNEDGSKRWWSTYPGTVIAWKIMDQTAGGLSLDSFPDVNKDGKRKVRAYVFGAGDQLTVKTFVHVTRTDKGYEVRANVPCTVTLPGKQPVKITEKDLSAPEHPGVFQIQ